MPEQEHVKVKPAMEVGGTAEERRARAGGVVYGELMVTSNFSFLRGASHPEELVAAAAESGCRWVAMTDLHTVAGIVRGHVAAKEAGVGFVVGCRVMVKREELRNKGTEGQREGDAYSLSSSVPQFLSTCPFELLLYPTTRAAYGRMCRMLTVGKRRAEKGECRLWVEDVLAHAEGMLGVIVPPSPEQMTEAYEKLVQRVREGFGEDGLSVASSCLYDGHDRARLAMLSAFGRKMELPLVATNDVHYHVAERRPLQDVVTCVRLGCTVAEAGFALFANAERHIKGPVEMARLYREYPEAIARTAEIAERASGFSLEQMKYEYPDEICPAGKTAMEYLRERTWAEGEERYGGEALKHRGTEALRGADASTSAGTSTDAPASLSASVPLCVSAFPSSAIPPAIRERLEHELDLIEELDYPAYFLTVYDLVKHARSLGILCQGRGAAANSAVCFCLGITAVDPTKVELLMERFISRERKEPPDIDIDFEHERREEVIQYIYKKYGRDRAALVAEVISYRRRSAIRDVGKALGLSLDCVDRLAKSGDWWDEEMVIEKRLRELGFNPHDVTIRRAVKLAGELRGFPRHLSQHVGGFVISRGPLCEIVPIENAAMENRTVIEWDKDDIDDMGMLKVDCLGLGMLTCIRKALAFVNSYADSSATGSLTTESQRYGGCTEDFQKGEPEKFSVNTPYLCDSVVNNAAKTTPLQFHTVPQDDDAVYEMLCKADSIGVFQVESRAQMTMLPRLKPRTYYDLVIEVAIVRPGPIQGGMVHPYLRRREGLEEPTYPNDAVKDVLKRTKGVPLFQEQVMRLVMVAAGFSAGDADKLRRAMASWKRKGHIVEKFLTKIITGMEANGYTRAYALRVVEQIKGFSDYGFPESHAASFALLVYVSAWLKCRHPAAFAAALINSQPMGFYQPAQIVRDAREHGVEVRAVDVNWSGWNCSLEGDEKALRHEGTEAQRGADASMRVPAHARGSSPALRLGMRLVASMRQIEADTIAAAVRKHGPFFSIEALWRASGVRVAAMRALAQADAFGSMELDRQRALWEVMRLRDEELPLFERPLQEKELRNKGTKELREMEGSDPLSSSVLQYPGTLPLPPISASTQVVHDYAATGLSLKAHPVSFARGALAHHGVIRAGDLMEEKRYPDGKKVAVAGLVLVRQRPGTASGIVFVTLEDETGVANLVVRPAVYERYRRAVRHSVALVAWGKVERQGQVVHVLVERAANLADIGGGIRRQDEPKLESASRDFH